MNLHLAAPDIQDYRDRLNKVWKLFPKKKLELNLRMKKNAKKNATTAAKDQSHLKFV